ncbi:hypothetical protein HAX54_018460 [Datura stramonium]|uniref:Uncharacterized protein n=1 Tax=Datura stramonium TaxID=4076 RepID=A0ABS8UPJ9_DATST|nr:hypothetical protein [Datura stramonium]
MVWGRKEVVCAVLDQHDQILIEVFRYERLVPEVNLARKHLMNERHDRRIERTKFLGHCVVTTARTDLSPLQRDRSSGSSCAAAETERQIGRLTVFQDDNMSRGRMKFVLDWQSLNDNFFILLRMKLCLLFVGTQL